MATQDEYIRTALRVPPNTHALLHEAAKTNNRTFNAEILSRLNESFERAEMNLPVAVKDAVDWEVESRGGTPEEALTRLVLLGQTSGGTVFQVTLKPGVTNQEMREMMEVAKTIVPPDASIILHRA